MLEYLIDSGFHHVLFNAWMAALSIVAVVLSSIAIHNELTGKYDD